MLTKKVLKKGEIAVLRILVGHLRDVDCYQKPQDIKSDLHNISNQLYNLTLQAQFEKEREILKNSLPHCPT